MKILGKFSSLKDVRIVLEPGDLMWGNVTLRWYLFTYCPGADITLIDEGSGLVLTGTQLQMIRDWRRIFSFDSEGNPPDADRLSEEIEWTLDDCHLTLAQIHEMN